MWLPKCSINVLCNLRKYVKVCSHHAYTTNLNIACQIEPGNVSTLSKFIKDTKKGEIIAAALDGKLLSANEAKALATIPSKEEILQKCLAA